MTRRHFSTFNGPVTGIIEHLCARPEHQPPEDVAEPVIVYAGALGYCPSGTAEGHDWRATGGRTLGTVRDWLGRPPVNDEARQPTKAVAG